MSNPVPITTQATAVPGWLKWLVGTMGAAIAAGAPTAASLYLDARKQAHQAEAYLAEQAGKTDVLRIEAFAKASRANDLSDELGQCQATVDKLIDRLGVSPSGP